ncbi:hypothetical protein JCM10908_003815 [Rhodotorula pacifica]|uniref:tRNA (uracil) methyltransferase n=1 Tax=Rhodotorula pacifica TaxID=1495444 RepID=UPI003174E09D
MPGKAVKPTALAADAPRPLARLSRPPSLQDWLPVVSIPLECHAEHFHKGMLELVLHPEQSSSTILRADILADEDEASLDAANLPRMDGYRCVRRVRRRILPNRPQFDWAMEQECLFFDSEPLETGDSESLVLLLSDFDRLEQERGERRLPYYHPQVFALAFRYFSDHSGTTSSLRIDLVPLPDQPLTAPLPPNDRLFRTAQMLAKYAAKVCNGQAAGFQKRIHHDLLVGRTAVQDTYQRLKDKYQADLDALSPSPRITFRWMLNSWQESTDATKHVFEDVAIAAWLVVYWHEVYPESGGKPPGGFVDVGCGNGLLVYILASEGYSGYGFDLRERKSWATYTSPRPDLRVQSLDPVELLSHHLDHDIPMAKESGASEATEPTSSWPFPRDSFLIFNHADEMTPWCPLLAALTPGDHVGFLNIPCCLHELVGRFERQTYSIPARFLATLPQPDRPSPTPPAAESPSQAVHPLLLPFYAASPPSFRTGGGTKANPSSAEDVSILGGRYHAYQLYLAHLTLRCGFVPAREALRIPSTKNFGLVGGRSAKSPGSTGQDPDEIRDEVRSLVEEVRRRGEWKARRPEGKAGEKSH